MNDPGKDAVYTRLGALGFQVEKIAESRRRRTPDLRASKDGTTMYVEVKTRTVDANLRTEMESVRAGATVDVCVPLDKQNWLSSVVKKANEQLKVAAKKGELTLLWFRNDDTPFIQGIRDQIGATLLGIRMVSVRRNGENEHIHCIYANLADFYRCTSIDGVIVEENDGGLILIPNQFSPRHQAFVLSPIHRAVEPAIVDVDQLEQEGRCYVVDDSGIDRRNDEIILSLLRTKYPADEFLCFTPPVAVTTVTTIDARRKQGT